MEEVIAEAASPMEGPPSRTGGLFPRGFWWLACAIYASLIYSTGLHIGLGPERSVSLQFFKERPGEGVADLTAQFPDQGRWRDESESELRYRDWLIQTWFPEDLWKVSTAWADAGYYVRQCHSLSDSIPPYRYRPVPTLVVGAISRALHLWVNPVFAIFNALLIFATAVLFTAYLHRSFSFSPLVSLIGGILFITMLPNTSTMAFPLLEPASMLFIMLMFIALAHMNVWLFVISSFLGVLTKEILVVGALLWFLNGVDWRSRDWRRWSSAILPCAIPLLAFVGIRIALGGGALEVNYGYNILKGEFPYEYAARLLDPFDFVILWFKMFLGFGFLWAGLINLRRHPFLWKNAILVVLVIAATIALSGRIIRPLGVLFPILIPAFLLFFDRDSESTGTVQSIPC